MVIHEICSVYPVVLRNRAKCLQQQECNRNIKRTSLYLTTLFIISNVIKTTAVTEITDSYDTVWFWVSLCAMERHDKIKQGHSSCFFMSSSGNRPHLCDLTSFSPTHKSEIKVNITQQQWPISTTPRCCFSSSKITLLRKWEWKWLVESSEASEGFNAGRPQSVFGFCRCVTQTNPTVSHLLWLHFDSGYKNTCSFRWQCTTSRCSKHLQRAFLHRDQSDTIKMISVCMKKLLAC